MNGETRVELHSRDCSCRGGAWVLLESTQQSPCSGEAARADRLVLGLAEWRQFGKPASLDVFKEVQERSDSGDRRQFQRFEVCLPVRIERIGNWRDPSEQVEDTTAEVIAAGGTLVRSRMAVDKGEIIRFRLGTYETRAEVMYASSSIGPAADEVQRLGLKFLDAPLPDSFIPADARALPY
jgi:hypothetical protein